MTNDEGVIPDSPYSEELEQAATILHTAKEERDMTGFEYDGKTYELDMTRAGAAAAEAQGLSASQIAEKPFSSLYLLVFAATFSRYKLNPNKATALTDHIMDSAQATMSELIEVLSEQYTTLFGLGESE